MTQTETILMAFYKNGYKITLSEALKHPWGYKLTSRISDLRKKGHQIEFKRGCRPSENSWTLTHWDPKGQGSLRI